MAGIDEIIQGVLPGELIRIVGYDFYNGTSIAEFAQRNGITELDDIDIVYTHPTKGYTRPFSPNLTQRFDGQQLKVSSVGEIRSSSLSLPDYFFDQASGLTYFQDEADETTPDDGYTVVSTTGVRYKPKENYVTPEVFGALGDGIHDDTAAFSKMLSYNNVWPVFPRGKTYRLTSELIVENKTLDLNGCTLEFHTVGATRGLWMKSNSTLKNGVVINNVTGGASSGEFGAGVLVGKYTFTEEVKNVLIENVSISSTRAGGIALSIVGNIHEVEVKNCVFPDSTVNAYAITVHWGMLTSTPSEGTFHPHNIRLSGLHLGNFSNNGSDAGVVAISGSYNVELNNIFIAGSNKRAVYAFAGDYGFDYASAEVKKCAHAGLVVRNLVALNTAVYGIDINGNGNLGTSGVWSMPILFENVTICGTGAANSRGFNVGAVRDARLVNCKAIGLFAGFVEAGVSERVILQDCIAQDCTNYGYWIQGVAGSEGKNWLLESCKALDCNTSSTASRGAFHIDNQHNITLSNCYVDSALSTWGVRIGTNVTGASLYNNYVQAAASVAYSLGSAGVYTTMSNFEANKWEAGIATGVGGMAPLIVETRPNNTRRLRGTAAPASGSWLVGDEVENTTKTELGAAASKYVISRWVCSVAGTPGTWLQERSFTGN